MVDLTVVVKAVLTVGHLVWQSAERRDALKENLTAALMAVSMAVMREA